MEKISGEDLVEMTNAVNEIIDRLKTLEDKVKFIMENTDVTWNNSIILSTLGEQKVKHKSLQDLWDETVSKKETVKPTVK